MVSKLRERRPLKALVKSGHVTPQILDIFVTWPYYGYASTGGGGGELIEVSKLLNIFKNIFQIHTARDTNQDRKINVFMSFFYFRWVYVLSTDSTEIYINECSKVFR